jgi:DNA mismatch endonuclease (patch repair protein)
MAAVPSHDTKPEKIVRSAAHRLGLRFRLRRPKLPGTPDLIFPKWRVVIFVHGCFWHRHPGCRRASMPKTNPGYWAEKFSRNVVRDREAAERLGGLGWKVVTIWECECRDLNAAAQKLCEIFGIDGTNSSD